jgi:hypothetical protein
MSGEVLIDCRSHLKRVPEISTEDFVVLRVWWREVALKGGQRNGRGRAEGGKRAHLAKN